MKMASVITRFFPGCRRRVLLGLLVALLGAVATPALAQTVEWVQRLGGHWDTGLAMSADGLGNVYVSGLTTGSLGEPFAGYFDAFVAKNS